MVRPKNQISTIQKTYMLYEEDVNVMLTSGKAPKDVFRLGILAINSGWTPTKDSFAVDDLKKRIKNMSWTLESYIDKFNKLAHIVEKGLKIKVDDEVMKTKELERRLKLLDEKEKQLKE
jgi:hypothetical protein